MSFLSKNSSDEEHDQTKIYQIFTHPDVLSTQVFDEYKDFSRSICGRLMQIPLRTPRTFGDYLSGCSLGWNQEVQLSNRYTSESQGVFEVFRSDTFHSKAIIAIISLLDEIELFMENVEDKVYEPLLIFGEEKEFLPSDVVSENKEFYVTKLVGVLNEMHEIIKNLNVLLKHLVNQLNFLYSKNLKEYQQVFKKVLFLDAFDAIGNILVSFWITFKGIFASIDMLVAANAHLTSAWKGFKEILFGVRSDISKFGINEVNPIKK
eukprot:TRINITY_DN16292_c0_g1_i2.p1 TRINITY_DN16292_c0_g1~~TRINITY_DN16292_c0_g1_i2.p1  ORF type:complete len:263 (-),score=80.12 TRINITY_DN16292_c0_g1_i2:175-963(-)